MKNILIAVMLLILLFGCTDSPPEQQNDTKPAPAVPSSQYQPATVERKTPTKMEPIPSEQNDTYELPEPLTKYLPLPNSTLTPCRGPQPPEPKYDISGIPFRIPDGPWFRRIMIARSYDGINWKGLDKILFDSSEDQDAVIDKDNRIYVYAMHYCNRLSWLSGNLSVAITNDAGYSWHYYNVKVGGLKTGMVLKDPHVILLPDGRFRMYFSSPAYAADDVRPQCKNSEGKSIVRCPRIFSAISTDGIYFAVEKGVRFEVEGEYLLDTTVLYADDRYWLFSKDNGSNKMAVSDDGLNFAAMENYCYKNNDRCLILANGLAVPDGYRFYADDFYPLLNRPVGIYSLFSKNGRAWSIESGQPFIVEPEDGLESEFINDPSVVKFGEEYWMFYATKIPEKDNANPLYYVNYADLQPGYENLYCEDGYCDEYERTHPGSVCSGDCPQ